MSSRICGRCLAPGEKFDPCPSCGAWYEGIEPAEAPRFGPQTGDADAPAVLELQPLSEAAKASLEHASTGCRGLDHVLGGGFVAGQVALLAGDPGAGKSTLALQAAAGTARLGAPRVVYLSSEENQPQIGARAARLAAAIPGILAGCGQDLEAAIDSLSTIPAADLRLVVLDSIQLFRSRVAGAGDVEQLEHAGGELVRWAKSSGVPVLVVCQVNKEGDFAGPRALEHVVDTNLYLELIENPPAPTVRRLRARKNRFGACHNVADFFMTQEGLLWKDDPMDTPAQDVKPAAAVEK